MLLIGENKPFAYVATNENIPRGCQRQQHHFGPGNFLSHHRKSISIYYLHCTNELNGVNGDVHQFQQQQQQTHRNRKNSSGTHSPQLDTLFLLAQGTQALLSSPCASLAMSIWKLQKLYLHFVCPAIKGNLF